MIGMVFLKLIMCQFIRKLSKGMSKLIILPLTQIANNILLSPSTNSLKRHLRSRIIFIAFQVRHPQYF